MHRIGALCILLCLAITASAVAQDAGQGVLLRVKYQVGETVVYRVTMKGVGSFEGAGQEQPIDIEGSLLSIMRVESVDEAGNYTILNSFDNLDIAVKVSNMDLDTPISLPTLKMVVTPAGEVREMELLEQESEQEPGLGGLAGMLSSSLDLESLLQDVKIPPFPKEAVRPGDEWDANVPLEPTTEGEEPRQIKTHLRYAGNEEKLGRRCVKLETTRDAPFGGGGGEAGMFDIEGTEHTEGTLWFDPGAGRVVADRGTSQVALDLKLTAGLAGEEQQIPIRIELVADTEAKLLMPEAEHREG